jgi:hypothetical protein
MSVCMYVSMSVCMYVCNVCMFVCNVSMDVCVYVCMCVCQYVSMSICQYVSMYRTLVNCQRKMLLDILARSIQKALPLPIKMKVAEDWLRLPLKMRSSLGPSPGLPVGAVTHDLIEFTSSL